MLDRVVPDILSVGRSKDGDHYLRVAQTIGGHRIQCTIRAADVSTMSLEHLGIITNASRHAFAARAEEAIRTMRPSFRVTTEAGWEGVSFVLPNGVAIPPRRGLFVCMPTDVASFAQKFRHRGTLRDWKRIPRMAEGNSWLMLIIALAFVGPVALLLDLEAPVIQLVGAPNDGKTTGAATAASVVGRPDLESWNGTPGYLELLARALHGTLLVLDETKLAKITSAIKFDEFLAAFFTLAEGSYRGRLTDGTPTHRFRLPILTTSNESLGQIRNRVGGNLDDAHSGRILDVPVDPDGRGSIRDLHDFADRDAFLDAMRTASRASYGVAFREYLEGMAEWLTDDARDLRRFLDGRRQAYLAEAKKWDWATTRDLARVHNRMATIYAAGALAIELKILPWTYKELGASILDCQRGHVALVEKHTVRGVGKGVGSAVDPLARLAAHFSAASGGFVDLRAPTARFDPARVCIGQSHGHREYWLMEALVNRLLGSRKEADQLKRQLDAKGLLASPSHRHSTRRSFRGQRVQLLAIRADAFDAFLAASQSGPTHADGRSGEALVCA